MATSGTVTYRTNRNQIINSALRLCGALDQENTAGATTNQLAYGSEALNLMIKSWEAIGLQLWERKYGVVFTQYNQNLYALGSPGPGGDHACLSTPLFSGFVQTTLAADAASGASTITVNSTTGSVNTVGVPGTTISNTYNIGIELDSGYLQWTTVSGAPSGTTVTLAATLTDDASEGAVVYCYQTKLVRPMRILDAFVHQTVAGNDVPVNIISREQYNRFGSKSSPGQGIQLYYDPQANTGYIQTYPSFVDVSQYLVIEFTKPIEDITGSTDDYDLPQEWGEALKFNLAVRLAPEYDVPMEKFKQISALAELSLGLVKGYDVESPAGVTFQPSAMTTMQNG